jgi:hypothetical protein
MLILNCTVILVTPTYRHPSHTGSRGLFTALFRANDHAEKYGDGS